MTEKKMALFNRNLEIVYRHTVMRDTLEGLATCYKLNGRQAVLRVLREAKVSPRMLDAVARMTLTKAAEAKLDLERIS